jgi:hypothetical protein
MSQVNDSGRAAESLTSHLSHQTAKPQQPWTQHDRRTANAPTDTNAPTEIAGTSRAAHALRAAMMTDMNVENIALSVLNARTARTAHDRRPQSP